MSSRHKFIIKLNLLLEKYVYEIFGIQELKEKYVKNVILERASSNSCKF